jgi:putative oligomerization/nucleic acid binding protein
MSRNSKDPKKERLEKHNQVLRFGDIYPLLKPIMSICRDEPTMFGGGLQTAQAQTREPSENKDDALHRLEKLGNLRQQGLITDEEFQRMKSKLISSI